MHIHIKSINDTCAYADAYAYTIAPSKKSQSLPKT